MISFALLSCVQCPETLKQLDSLHHKKRTSAYMFTSKKNRPQIANYADQGGWRGMIRDTLAGLENQAQGSLSGMQADFAAVIQALLAAYSRHAQTVTAARS